MSEILQEYANQVVLITGGAGAIGSHLVKALLALGAKVVVFDDLSSGRLANLTASPNLRFFRLDITDDAEVSRLFSRFRPKFVFNLAAHYANLRSIQEPRRNLEVNALAVLTLLECCVRWNSRRFIQASSSCVYDHQAKLPLTEEATLKQDTPYGISKQVAEEYCRFFADFYAFEVTVLRYFNSFGPGDYPGVFRSVIPNMFERAIKNEPLEITGSGRETRDFTFVTDIVQGTLLAGVSPRGAGEVFNIASGAETPIWHLAELVNRISHNRAGVSYVPKRPWDLTTRRLASIEKARRLLGYQPTVSLFEGLQRTYHWFTQVVAEV